MEEKSMLRSWFGEEVVVGISGAGPQGRRPEEVSGKLREVNEMGVVMEFTFEKDGQNYRRDVLYPWRVVDWMRLAEDELL